MNLQDILGIEYPILQGGMANISRGVLAAAVSEAGGLGLVASSGFTPEEFQEEIRIAKKLTNKPIGASVILIHPELEKINKIVIEEGIKIITTGAGNPAPYFEMWQENGIKVIPVIANVKMAKRVESLGAVACVAEGAEAGGHIGALNTMAMLPQIVDAVNIPVIAAGGIASGRQMLAAEVLGASGVQMGTRFLMAKECPVHPNYKEALIKAIDSDTAVTGYTTPHPVRLVKNELTDKYIDLERKCTPESELEKLTVGSHKRAALEGDMVTGSIMAGQVASMLTKEESAEEIIKGVYNEYLEAKNKIVKEVLEKYLDKII